MKNVRLIRHGESAANAGEPTRDHASIPLTAKGLEQPQMVAHSHKNTPALIVTLLFLRPKQPHWPLRRFTQMAFEIWPVHKFTYLAPARCADTTLAQQHGLVENKLTDPPVILSSFNS